MGWKQASFVSPTKRKIPHGFFYHFPQHCNHHPLLLYCFGVFLKPMAFVLGGTAMKPHYLLLLVIILCVDVLGAIPFANLRFKKRPIRFALIKIINVLLTIAFNLFFFLACPRLQQLYPEAFSWFDISKGIDYILFANLAASVIQFLMVSPELHIRFTFDRVLLRKMLRYFVSDIDIGYCRHPQPDDRQDCLSLALPGQGKCLYRVGHIRTEL